MPRLSPAVILSLLLLAVPASGQKVLFDARHGQTAGQADWIVDADTSELRFRTFRCQNDATRHHSAQRFPTPPQSEVRLDTPEDFWTGGISAWGIALAKDALNPQRGRTWQIEQYPWNAPPMTYGDAANSQDLSNYDVLILCEPNIPYTEAEAEAILHFVEEGGGLFLVADHETSDRDCSGGPGGEKEDSPFILNRLMRTQVQTDTDEPYFDPADPDNDFGVFGIWFHENGNDDEQDSGNRRFDWFDEAINNNASSDPLDPIVAGPFGSGRGGLGLFGSTQMAISTHPEKGNPTARAHVWRNGQSQQLLASGVSERVTLASAVYGQGRVVAVGDSSPADDDTGQGQLHPGWDKASGGVANHILFLNATEWLAGAEPDIEAPDFTEGPAVSATDCQATVTWTTDEPALGDIDWGEEQTLPQHTSTTAAAARQVVSLSPLEPGTAYRYQVAVVDLAGNGPTRSAVLTFETAEPQPPRILAGPSVTAVTDDSAVIVWGTDEPGTSVVRYGTHALDRSERGLGPSATGHSVPLAGLTAATTYQIKVETTDSCGETAESATASFTTAAAPQSRDLSGWKLSNDQSPSFELTFPSGTAIPANGYLVVGRDSHRAVFEAEWGALHPSVVYVDAGDKILINGTARRYRLSDGQGNVVDGFTATVRSGESKRRTNGCAEGAPAWSGRAANQGDPGRGAPPACGAGVILTEMADGRAFPNEFVELYFDAGPPQ